MKSIRSLLLKSAFLLGLSLCLVHADDFTNGDFENGFQEVKVPAESKSKISGDVGTAWRDESAWGDVVIFYSKDVSAHGGAAAQKIEVKAITKGGVQFVQQVSFVQGTTYHLSAWVKAAAPGEMDVVIRQSGPPYQTYGTANVQVTTEWTKVEISGVATSTDNGLIMFNPKAPGIFWIDDVILKAGD